jgi:hypothetical protein
VSVAAAAAAAAVAAAAAAAVAATAARRSVVTWYMKPWCLPGEVMTDMYYPIYADGLYEALMQVRRDGGKQLFADCKVLGMWLA